MEIKEFIDPVQLKKISDIEISEKVFVRLTNDEVVELKNALAEKQIFLAKRKGYLKSIQESFKMLDSDTLLDQLSKLEVVNFGEFGTKTLTKQIADITIMLDEMGGYTDMKLYGIADYEFGVMLMYKPDGNYLYYRELTEYYIKEN